MRFSWVQRLFNTRKNKSKAIHAKRQLPPLELVPLESRITPAATLTFTGTALTLVSDGNENEDLFISATGQVLNLATSTGNITVDASVADATGGGTQLVTVNLANAAYSGANLTGITLKGQSAFDKTTTLTVIGALDLTAVTATTDIGLSLIDGSKNQDNDVAIGSLVKTQGKGPLLVDVGLNAGSTLSIAAGGDITSGKGIVSFKAGGGISTAGDITTSDGAINFNSAATLTGAVSLNTNATTTAGDITLGAITGGTNNLTLQTGGVAGADIQVFSVSGVGTLTISNSGITKFTTTVSAASVVISDTLLAVEFDDNLNLTTGLTTAAKGYQISIGGASNSIAGTTTFLNTDNVFIGRTGASTIFVDGVTATDPDGVNIRGTVAATTGTITLGDDNTQVTADFNATVGGAATGLITIGKVFIGDGATLTLGTGIANNINLQRVNGGIAPNLTFNTTGIVSVTEGVSIGTGTVTITNSGGITFASTVSAASGVISDTQFAFVKFSGNLNLSTGLTTAAQNYAVEIDGTSNSIAGNTTFLNKGSLVLGNENTDATTFVGGVTATDQFNVFISGTVAATTGASTITLGDANTPVIVGSNATVGGAATGAITLADASLSGDVTLTVGTGIGNAIKLDSVAGTAKSNLTINTTGFVSVTKAVGPNFGTITITNSGGITFASTVSAASVVINDTEFDVSFQDNLTLTTGLTTAAKGYGVSFFGTTNNIAGNTTFLNTNIVQIGNGSGDSTTFVDGVTATSVVYPNGTVGATSGASAITFPSVFIITNASIGGAATGLIDLGNVSMNPSSTLTVGTGITNNINLGSVKSFNNVGGNLTINTTGAVSVTEAVGPGFGTVTITNSGGASFLGNVIANTMIIADTSDGSNIVFGNGSQAVILGTLTTAAQGYGIQFLNAATLISAPVVINNAGGLAAGNGINDSINLPGGATIGAGTLSGSGVINGPVFVLSGATVAPGNSPGILTFMNGLFFTPGSSFIAEINGVTTPGVDYDQAVVTGAVVLNNATLVTSSSGPLSPDAGDVVTLIANDGADAVSGTFNGLPENSKVTVGGVTFVLSYQGGDGNDVVLEFAQKQGVLASSGLGADPITGIVSSNISIFTQGNPNPIVVTPFPYFTGDLHVATGDINNDGTDDVIVGAGPGAGPAVAIFNGITGNPISAFFPYNTGFSGGVFVATGDLNGDGILEIITGAGPGGGPHVGVFESATLTPYGGFFAYDTAFTGGVTVAAGDFNNDGIDEIATGAGAGGGPNVRVFSGPGFGFSMMQSFFAYAPNFTGGVFVAAGDLLGDGADELITGAGAGGGPRVTIFNGSNSQALASFFAYDIAFTGGVRVGTTDYLGDGEDDVVTGAGVGGAPHVKIFNNVNTLVDQFFSGDIGYTAGIFVSGGPGALGLPI